MTVEEIQAKLPGAQVYSLAANANHIIVFSRHRISRHTVNNVLADLAKANIRAIGVGVDSVPDEAIRILSIEQDDSTQADDR